MSANAERIAVNLGGEAWEMRQEEKDAIDAALTDIFTAWEYDGMNNPYAALVLASGMYIFGPGRATPAGMWTRTREFFARRKEAKESAAATDDETDENESPAD